MVDVKYDAISGEIRENDLTQLDKDKLDQSMQGFLGVFVTYAQFVAKYPTGALGQYAFLKDTATYWAWDAGTSTWTNTGSAIASYTKAEVDSLLTAKQAVATLEADVSAKGFIKSDSASGAEAKLWTEKGTLVELLNSDGKVLSAHLPSYVDDVLEYSSKSAFPATGETGKIYIDTSDNKTYRWGGTTYVEISQSLAIGEVSGTAFEGSRGKSLEDNKLDKNQGVSHAGDYLKVQSDGSIGFAGGSTVTVNWGSINGTMSNQTDLTNALNEKLTAPTGGTVGQYLKKTESGTEWSDVSGGVVSVNTKTGTVTLYANDISMSSTDTTKINEAIAAKSLVTLSATGTSTTEAKYITLDGTEWKLSGGVEIVNAKTGAVTLYGSDISLSSTDSTKIDAAFILKQNVTDNTLYTTAKTIVGAINELNSTKVTAISGKGLSTNDFVSSLYYTAATVDAKISSMSGTFRGNFATKAALDAYSGTKVNGDYAIVDTDETHSSQKWRYVYNGSTWVAEYRIDGSSAQWGMITGTLSVQSDLWTKFSDYYTKSEIDAKISSGSAAFRGNFPTYMDLMNYTGTKMTGDYAVVLSDELHSNECWRYKYMISTWLPEYRINETALTAEQMAAINSGITAAKVTAIDTKLDNPVGGADGQVLTKTATGTAWTSPSYGSVRKDSTAYAVGAMVLYSGTSAYLLKCTTAGTSYMNTPNLPNPIVSGVSTLVDGSVVWVIYDMSAIEKLNRSDVPMREQNKEYFSGNRVMADGKYGYILICTTGGTSSSGAISWPTSIVSGVTTLTDGTVTWTIYDAVASEMTASEAQTGTDTTGKLISAAVLKAGADASVTANIGMRENSKHYLTSEMCVYPGKPGWLLWFHDETVSEGTTDSTLPAWPTGTITPGVTTLTDGTVTWTLISTMAPDMTHVAYKTEFPLRYNSDEVRIGNRVTYPGKAGYVLECTTAGTTASSVPAWPSSIVSGVTTLTDGTAVWKIYDTTAGEVTKADICLRKNSTAYAVGAKVLPAGHYSYVLTCKTAGTSASNQPNWPSSIQSGVTQLLDGGVTWIIEDALSQLPQRTTVPSSSETAWLNKPFLYIGSETGYKSGHIYMLQQQQYYWILTDENGMVKYAADPLASLNIYKNLYDDAGLKVMSQQYVYKTNNGTNYYFHNKNTYALVSEVVQTGKHGGNNSVVELRNPTVFYGDTIPADIQEGDLLVYDGESSYAYTKTESDARFLNPDNIVVKDGTQFSLAERPETFNSSACLFYDTKGTKIKAEIAINFRITTTLNAGIYRWGMLLYNGHQLPPVYGWHGGAYTENLTCGVSIAFNQGNGAVYAAYHGQLEAGKLIVFTAHLWFNRADLVEAGILS